ncbi:MAG: BON domain-containing protein [Acidobacteriota bacterium]
MSRRRIFSVLLLSFMLMASVGFAATSTTETAGDYVDDSVITTKVKAAIMDEPGLKTLDIKVVTEKGVVTLSGMVSTKAEVTKAGDVARGVKGVKSVKNDLKLK